MKTILTSSLDIKIVFLSSHKLDCFLRLSFLFISICILFCCQANFIVVSLKEKLFLHIIWANSMKLDEEKKIQFISGRVNPKLKLWTLASTEYRVY